MHCRTFLVVVHRWILVHGCWEIAITASVHWKSACSVLTERRFVEASRLKLVDSRYTFVIWPFGDLLKGPARIVTKIKGSSLCRHVVRVLKILNRLLGSLLLSWKDKLFVTLKRWARILDTVGTVQVYLSFWVLDWRGKLGCRVERHRYARPL